MLERRRPSPTRRRYREDSEEWVSVPQIHPWEEIDASEEPFGRQRPHQSPVHSFKSSIRKKFFSGVLAVSISAPFLIANEAVNQGHHKNAIELRSLDSNSAKPLGYIFGPRADNGENTELYGFDRSIPVAARDLEKKGDLALYYKALMALEDHEHEGGWSDWIGISPRLPKAVLQGQGGSSIADQACGSMMEGSWWYKILTFNQTRMGRKVVDSACAVGLAAGANLYEMYSPKEIGAMYASYTYLSKYAEGVELFVRLYWGLEGIHDSRLTPAHQLILAALPNKTWTGNDARWKETVQRAKWALKKLEADDVISKREAGKITKQLYGLKPKVKPSDLKSGQVSRKLAPPSVYDSVLVQVKKEAENTFGSNWDREISSVTLSTHLGVQRVAESACQQALKKVDTPGTHCMTFVVGHPSNRVYAAYNGDASGVQELNRFNALYSPASLGKLFVVASHDAHQPNGRLVEGFARSNDAFVVQAKAMEINPQRVSAQMACFGFPNEYTPKGEPLFADPLIDAAKGNFLMTPWTMANLIETARSGHVRPDPRMVDFFERTIKKGKKKKISPTSMAPRSHAYAKKAVIAILTKQEPFRRGGAGWSTQYCGVNLWNQGLTSSYLAAPVERKAGTLHPLQGKLSYGKTGTVGHREMQGAGNNHVWAIGGWEAGQGAPDNFYTALVGIGLDRPGESVAGLEPAGKATQPVLGLLINAVRKGERTGFSARGKVPTLGE